MERGEAGSQVERGRVTGTSRVRRSQGSRRAWRDLLFGGRVGVTRSWGHENVPLEASVSPITEERRPCAEGDPDVEGLEFEASGKGLGTSLTPPFPGVPERFPTSCSCEDEETVCPGLALVPARN